MCVHGVCRWEEEGRARHVRKLPVCKLLYNNMKCCAGAETLKPPSASSKKKGWLLDVYCLFLCVCR